ncbi:MAG: hypothetical protein ACREI9_00735 [Nitrospiraceae bacterium]
MACPGEHATASGEMGRTASRDERWPVLLWRWWPYLGGALLGAAGSLAILFLGLPISRSAWFTLESLVYWVLMGSALILAARSLASRLQRHDGQEPASEETMKREHLHRFLGAGALAGAFLVFALPVASVWFTGRTTYQHIGGLLPWSDSNGYLYGALHLLHEGELDSWNMRRPLNASFLAFRLMLAGKDLQWALILQAWMVATACFLAARALVRTHGIASGLALFALLYEFARPYVGTLLSESLGLSFGCLAFAVLWQAALTTQPRISFGIGMLLLTLALTARAGAFFVLPALLLWAVWGGLRVAAPLRLIGWGIGGMAVAFLLNGMLLWSFGTEGGLFQANFAESLYGLAAGGKGYAQAYKDHPELLDLTAQGHSREAAYAFYKLAIGRIVADPRSFLKAYLNNLLHFGRNFFHFVDEVAWNNKRSGILQDHQLNKLLFVTSLCALVLLIVRPRDPSLRQLAMAVVAIVLSAPFLIQDGGFRLLAATMPYAGALPAIGLSLVSVSALKPQEGSVPSATAEADNPWFRAFLYPASVCGLVLTLMCVVGPFLAVAFRNQPALSIPACEEGLRSAVVRLGQGSPFLKILASSSKARTRAPVVHADDFWADPSFSKIEIASTFRQKDSVAWIVLGYDVTDRHWVWLVGDSGVSVPEPGDYAQMCGEEDPQTGVVRVRTISLIGLSGGY